MASIPLPALSIRPPQQQSDPLEQYGRLLQLRNAMQEAPLRQQALQQQVAAGQQQQQVGALELQQKQQAIKDQQAATAAYHEWDGKDFDQLPQLVLKNGGSAIAVNGIKKSLLEQHEAAAKLAAEDATTGSKNIETKLKQNDMVAGAIGSVLSMPDDQLAPGLVSTAQELANQKLIDPQHAQAAAQIAQSGNPAQIRQQLSILQKSYMGAAAQMTAAQKQAEIDHGKAQEAQSAATLANTIDNQKRVDQRENRRLNIESARLAFDQKRQGTQDADSIETQAQRIASGDVKALSQGRQNPRNAAIMSRVYEINPNYSDALYTTKQNFKTKGDAQSVVQLTTALDHLDSALANSQKVGFAPLLSRNATEADAAYNQDIKLFTQEAGKLVANKAITQHEYEDLISGMKSSRQGIRDAALNETVKLMGGKVEGMMQKYKTGTGRDLPTEDYFDQPTQERLKKYGIGGQQKQSGGFDWNAHPVAK